MTRVQKLNVIDVYEGKTMASEEDSTIVPVKEWLDETNAIDETLAESPTLRAIGRLVDLLEHPPNHHLPKVQKMIRTQIISSSISLRKIEGLPKVLSVRIKRLSSAKERENYETWSIELAKATAPILVRAMLEFPELSFESGLSGLSYEDQKRVLDSLTPDEIASFRPAMMKRDGLEPEDLTARCAFQ